jgi:Bacteriophage tail assembly protein
LIQGNASYFKDSLATRLAITVAGPGYVHFPLVEQAGFDQEFFAQLLSERKEKRKRLGVITTRWIQTRERNEALDLRVMCLCILEMFRGTLDTMQPVIADQTPKDTAPIQFGAQKVIVNDPVLANAFGWCVDLTTTHLALAHRPAVAFSGNPRCQRLQDMTGLRCLA